MNLFAEWLAQPQGQWNDWLTERVLGYPHAVQEAVRQEAEAYQRAWSRGQDHTRDALAREAAYALFRQQREAEYAERERKRRRFEEHSRQQLEAIRRRREEAEERKLKELQAWQALERDGAEWHVLVKENWPYELQPDCTGEDYELGMIEEEVMA